jgi:antitoxin HicB
MRCKERVSAAARAYTVLLQPEPEGGYTVTCPALPGLVTYGETLEEARAMAADAIRGYIECLREDGGPIQESDPAPAPLVDRVSVKAGCRVGGCRFLSADEVDRAPTGWFAPGRPDGSAPRSQSVAGTGSGR